MRIAVITLDPAQSGGRPRENMAGMRSRLSVIEPVHMSEPDIWGRARERLAKRGVSPLLRRGIGRRESLGPFLQGAEVRLGERLERGSAEAREEARESIGRGRDARMDDAGAAGQRLEPPVPVEPETLAH